MSLNKFHFSTRSRQRGVVLAVGLILLLVMSLVMIVAMSGSILQERMAGSLRNASMAEVGADSVLRDGELWVWKQAEAAGGVVPEGNTLEVGSALATRFRTSQQWETDGTSYGAGAGINFVPSDYYTMAHPPAFVVENLGELSAADAGGDTPELFDSGGAPPGTTEHWNYYRITGRSTGGNEGVIRVAESTFSIVYFQ